MAQYRPAVTNIADSDTIFSSMEKTRNGCRAGQRIIKALVTVHNAVALYMCCEAGILHLVFIKFHIHFIFIVRFCLIFSGYSGLRPIDIFAYESREILGSEFGASVSISAVAIIDCEKGI